MPESEQEFVPPVWEQEEATGKTLDLRPLMVACVRGWPLPMLMAAGGLALGLGIAFSLTPMFTSKVVFLPPPQRLGSTENPLSALLKPPSSDIYQGLLLSDSVVGEVVTQQGLQAKFKSRNLPEARLALRRVTTVSAETAGFVTLQVKAADPRLARDIAAGYLQSLTHLNDRLAASDAAQHRVFYKLELEREKNELANAEVVLKQAQEESGVVSPQSQTQAGLLAIESIRASIRGLEVRLAALRKSETDQASNVVEARSQLSALQGQLVDMEKGAGPAGGALSAARAPQLNLEFVKLEREVKYHQALFDAVSKQYENARLEEASSAPGVQVVDFPEVAVAKSWPSRLLFGIAGGFIGLFAGVLYLLLKMQSKRILEDPKRKSFLDELKLAARHPRLRS